MSKNTSITLGDYFQEFINLKISKGRYGSVSEVIRAGLRLLEERDSQLEITRKALIEGEKSGKLEVFESNIFLEKIHKKHV